MTGVPMAWCLPCMTVFSRYTMGELRMTPNRIARGMLFLIGMLMTGCASKRDETGPISYPRETARLVSHVTSDFIRAGDDIRVRFVSPVASGNRVGQTLDRDVFTFVPRIVRYRPLGGPAHPVLSTRRAGPVPAAIPGHPGSRRPVPPAQETATPGVCLWGRRPGACLG